MFKPLFKTSMDMARYFHFEVKTDSDMKRLCAAWMLYVDNYKGDGVIGCIAEVLTATPNSNKVTVSNVGRVDCYIKYLTDSGHVVPVSCERKTNGGRIQTVETEFSRAEVMSGKYVVYSMDICNAGTSYLRRRVNPVVIPRKLFVEKLREFNAIKAVNRHGILEGYAIQVSSKKLYTWLADWPIGYVRDAVYSDADFEGLE